MLYTEVGRQVGRFALHGDRTLFLFTFADGDPRAEELDLGAQKAVLHRQFGNSGWECHKILDALDAAPNLYFDRVSQIHLPAQPAAWSRGRVALVGDAAACASLLAGEGSGLAMLESYVLAGELHCAGDDYQAAFARYREQLDGFVRRKQRAALRSLGFFAPRSKLSLFVRNRLLSMMRIQWIANLTLGGFVEDMPIPAY